MSLMLCANDAISSDSVHGAKVRSKAQMGGVESYR